MKKDIQIGVMLMKWVSKDVDMYLGAKEYVDTVVLPLLPVSFGTDIKQTVTMSEFISLLSGPLEKQFKGRLLMLPGFTYLKNNNMDKHLEELKSWEKEFKFQDFKHIFYVTSDSDWTLKDGELEGSLIWLPSLPLENMDQNYKNTILEDQVKQMLNLFIKKWQKYD